MHIGYHSELTDACVTDLQGHTVINTNLSSYDFKKCFEV